MFISSISIKNYKLFDNSKEHVIEKFNIPDGINYGSGLTVFVGENGCGKTTILDAISLPLLDYKAEDFGISDMENPKEKTEIKIYSAENFNVAGTFPNTDFTAKGFYFKGRTKK